MRSLFVIIVNTIRIGLRKKFLLGLFFVCLLVLCSSLLLAQLSLDDKGRLTVDFGLASVQLLLVALAVFFGANFIAHDLDKKILWTIISRPVRPSVFFLGRYLGLSILLILSIIVLSILLLLFFIGLNIPVQLVLFYTLLGFLWESLLLLAFVLFFSSYAHSFLVLFYCGSIFIVGHFLDTLFYFIPKIQGFLGIILSQILHFVPNLEKVNWKSAVVYQDKIHFTEFLLSSFYMICWTGFILSFALLIMEKREYN